MRSIFPSAAILRQKYALVSSLRALGLPVASIDDAKPAPGDVFLIADGEVPPAPARTVVVGGEGRFVVPSRDGNPARIAYGP
ncbi:MAG: sigma-54-dependent Fis family transcriptional regulator, partial [Zymomonas sp.]|nr:sigma-54-dependent Fis family transcriptional regulator [Zymomonas sp.]